MLIETNKSVSINVYPNKLDTSIYEPCTGFVGQTLKQWLIANVPSYDAQLPPPFSVMINGQSLQPAQWLNYALCEHDTVSITVEPKDPATITLAVIAIVAVGTAIYAMSQIPDNYSSTTPDGSSIYDANVQGNRARLMGVVPEIFGTHNYYPSYLAPPRREYKNNEQYLYLFMCIGVGEYDLPAELIKIGETPINRYGADVNCQVFGPNELVTGHEAHRNVYTSKEVGGSAGQQGFELKGKIGSSGGSSSPRKWSFSGKRITSVTTQFDGGNEPKIIKTIPPFEIDEILNVSGTNSGQNDGLYRLVSKSIDGSSLQKVNAQYEDDDSWTGFVLESHSSAIITLENGSGDGEFVGAFFAIPEGEKTKKLWLDFKLPRGLGELDDNGNITNKTVELLIEYRDEDASTWQQHTKTFSNATNDELAETIQIILSTEMRPEVRVKRVTQAYDDTRVYDTVFWTQLKAELPTHSRYPDWTTIALEIRGNNALAGSAENKLNVTATRKLPMYENGVWTTPKATNDIAPAFAYAIKKVGHTDEQIGLEELAALHTTWRNRGDEFNAVFESDSTLFAALKRILACGFAEPTIDYGQIIPVRDQPRTQYQHTYTPDNYIGELKRTIKLLDDDEHDGVEVEYFDPVTWKPATVMCLLAGDQGINPEKIRAFGITSRDKAYQHGMRKRRERRYRRTRFEWKTEMDAFNSRYLDYCAVADDIPGYEQSGRVEYAIGRTLHLNNAPQWQSGQSHVIALRKPNGRLSGPYAATKGVNANEVVINQDLDFVPTFDGRFESPFYMFGVSGRWCNSILIKEVKPSGTSSASVVALLDDPRVYADDNSSAPD
ncbi:phage tail protein [Pseudoalteromonas luteoviolacea]|uniref:host specificity factor TipJ family phage tail protein n=1 Tax=Pseudoalteromonas luteoviolacea TaxID=43657 RepID=UPI001F414B79|nr:host specificity factor TipJ family phage tail protein [Pseudoalteromonas luteoviolacea]MCF6442016.1 phage tail protein [Pseudoalteromonas luteoviolacea]